MISVFPAVFETVWKRKETRVYLLFAFYALLYFAGSFFGDSNFMQLQVEGDFRYGFLGFWGAMMYSLDGFILPSLALGFLTISVFKREFQDHTMFLYKDVSRKDIFWSKYISLLMIVLIFFGLSFVVSLGVYFGRAAYVEALSGSFFEIEFSESVFAILSIFVVLLKTIFSVSVITLVCLYLSQGVTVAASVCLSIAMLITSMIGGPISKVFPSGYSSLDINGTMPSIIAGGSAALLTVAYCVVLIYFSKKKFQQLEF